MRTVWTKTALSLLRVGCAVLASNQYHVHKKRKRNSIMVVEVGAEGHR